MLESIKQTTVYSSLKLNNVLSHAYLFYSSDKEKNNQIALTFARTFVCLDGTGCGVCNGCKQFAGHSHPDVVVLEQDSIKVDDVKLLIEKLNTKPISASKKVFVILNAETINETAQNKLLKSLEEPNESTIFILTTTKTDKLLPTILSRLNKIFVPNFSVDDKHSISNELLKQNIDISKFVEKDFSLTEMLNLATNEEYFKTINQISQLFANLNSTADIPKVAAALDVENKQLFFSCLTEMLLSCLNDKENKFDEKILLPIKLKFNNKALMKCLPLVDEGYKYLMSNVNFSYILDNLLFNMLKEKFLCK